jgi:hypothetical protein
MVKDFFINIIQVTNLVETKYENILERDCKFLKVF